MTPKLHQIAGLTLLGLSSLLLHSCGLGKDYTRGSLYPHLYNEKPKSILIMPPINETNQVEAKDSFFATLMVPLAEQGYYVFSPFLTKELMQQESADDAELFFQADLYPFAEVFGADASLFTIIHRWEKKALVGDILIDVEYILRSTHTGETLFSRRIEGVLDLSTPQNGGGGLAGILATLVVDMVRTALTDKALAASYANKECVSDMPVGMYHTSYGKDKKTPAKASSLVGVHLYQ